MRQINQSIPIHLSTPLLEKGPPVLPPLKMLWSCYFWTCCACYSATNMKCAAVEAADKSRIRALLQLLQGAREGPAAAPPTSSDASALPG
jgi:hypothetical protein